MGFNNSSTYSPQLIQSQDKDLNSKELVENIIKTCLPSGELVLTEWYFEGIRLTHTVSRYHSFDAFSAVNHEDVVRLHFNLRGKNSFSYSQFGTKTTLQAGQHNMMYSKGFDITVNNEDLFVETFGIHFSLEAFTRLTQDANDVLKRFTDSILAGKNVMLSPQWEFYDLTLQNAIREILNCRFTGGLKKLFFLSKTIEILVLQAEAYDRMGSSPKKYIKAQADKDRLIEARNFVIKNMANPPSLSEVAQYVGLNEYKLKRGFKELFDKTVFGYLTSHRLSLAKQLLLDTQKTASEISYELGYASPQHFNNAFKREFGQTPNSLR